MVDTGEEYVAFGGPLESEQRVDESWWLNFHVRAKEKGMRARLLFNKQLQHWSGKIDTHVEIRFFEHINPLTETILFGNTTAIIVWPTKPIATVMRSKEVTQSYREFFKVLWKQAKK